MHHEVKLAFPSTVSQSSHLDVPPNDVALPVVVLDEQILEV